MTCSSCSSAIEQHLKEAPGILELSISLLSGKAEVRFSPHLAISGRSKTLLK